MTHSAFLYSALLLFITLSTVLGTIDNSRTAKSLIKSAVTLPNGSYQIVNVETGQKLHYVYQHGAYDLSPGITTTKKIMLEQFGGGTKFTRLSVGRQCASAQWSDQQGGVDNAMVLYACIGTKGATGTLEHNKQKWLLIPANPITKRSHAAQELSNSQLQMIPNSTYTNHQINSMGLDGSSSEPLMRRSKKAKTLANTHFTYYIVADDHLLDMKTRALGPKSIKTPGGAISTTLVPWKKGDKSQMWYFIKS